MKQSNNKKRTNFFFFSNTKKIIKFKKYSVCSLQSFTVKVTGLGLTFCFLLNRTCCIIDVSTATFCLDKIDDSFFFESGNENTVVSLLAFACLNLLDRESLAVVCSSTALENLKFRII